MQRDEILERYRRVREISKRHHSGALRCLAGDTILEHAKQLGLAHGRTIVAGSEEEMTLIFDLAIHTARPGRSRPIDRYAKAAAPASGSDEARTLEAMCRSRFSIWRIEGDHEAAGVVVEDVFRDQRTWLVDEGLTASVQPGFAFASRLYWPAEFAVTCGVVVPVDEGLLEDVVLACGAWLRRANPATVVDDARFAAAMYRGAIDAGIMDNVEFRESAIAS
jgi:hypothetical protein